MTDINELIDEMIAERLEDAVAEAIEAENIESKVSSAVDEEIDSREIVMEDDLCVGVLNHLDCHQSDIAELVWKDLFGGDWEEKVTRLRRLVG